VRHSLSYSHSDQALLRDPRLEECWDGLVVPGTLATYYFEGTGGFVLARRVPYLIDPRTPLLQTIRLLRPAPKASHLKLAGIHDPEVVDTWPEEEISRAHWEDGRWPGVVRRVLEFQTTYSTSATAKIDKYNQLLEEAGIRRDEEQPGEPLDPHLLVPPYWAVDGRRDPWWTLSRQAIELALDEHEGQVMPIITLGPEPAVDLAVFSELIADLPDGCREVFCWASNWNESEATDEDVAGWLGAIDAGEDQGVRVHNLYGGYLSVLLTGRGLAGVNHGVGYSESRDARRLSATGGPPARYYVPVLREFFTVPSAQPVIDHLPAEWACGCRVCDQVRAADGRPQVGRLNTEALKRHFLLTRHEEFVRVDAGLDEELDSLVETGEWVIANARDFLPEEDGERLLAWAEAIRPGD
jgi:hypothetical protein